VIRVLTRVFGISENAREKETNAQLWSLAEQLVSCAHSTANDHSPVGNCSALNQSLMELGALVCTPRQPRCEECPLAKLCIARREGIVEQLPNLGERIASTARRFAACVIERYGAVLVRQRPSGVVNGHLWEFPNVEVALQASPSAIRQTLESELGCQLAVVTPLVTVKHTITRYRITLEAFGAEANGTKLHARAGTWVKKNALEQLPFTSAHRRVLSTALKATAER
jgi:A/G-specific adenine glycosylase